MRRPGPGVTAAWLVPALAYVLLLGLLGITSKLALRTLSWHDLLLWTGIAYALIATVLLLLGKVELRWEGDTRWALASAVIAPTALILLYTSLRHGEASKVFPVTASYPAATVLLAAAILSESITLAKVAGTLLVLAGVVVISVSN